MRWMPKAPSRRLGKRTNGRSHAAIPSNAVAYRCRYRRATAGIGREGTGPTRPATHVSGDEEDRPGGRLLRVQSRRSVSLDGRPERDGGRGLGQARERGHGAVFLPARNARAFQEPDYRAVELPQGVAPLPRE